MRVLIFGDSITQGYWDTDGGWVERLRRHYDSIQAQNLETSDEPTVFNLGISADNSANILDRIVPETLTRTRHGKLPVVIVQIGVNDSSWSGESGDAGVGLPIEKYEENMQKIIDAVKPICSKLILVGLSSCDESKTMPVFWGDFYYSNEQIKRYEDVLEGIAEKNNISFIPIFDEFYSQIKLGKDYLPDGLHPNNDGHEFIYKLVLDKVDRIIANNY
jgi:lysophospholipase L1-like esterase